VESSRAGQLFPTWNYLPEGTRRTNVAVLNQCLADLVVVRGQVKTAHWNVKGPTFAQLHELFDEIAGTLEPHIDEVAERATALGGLARGSVREAASETAIPQLPPDPVTGEALLEQLAHTLSILDAELFRQMEAAEQQRDLDTVDLLNEVSRDVSKALWFLEAHLQGPAATPGGVRQGGSASGQVGPQQTLSQYQGQ
jgi:starvation-inducible DNA-binding protein